MKNDYTDRVQNSDEWLNQSEQFLLAAEKLIPFIKQKSSTPRTTKSNSLNVGSLKASLLLLAISVENALKSVKAKRKQIKIKDNGRIDRASFGGGSNGHDLCKIAEGIGVELSSDEMKILIQLTAIINWAGKYQQPLDCDEYANAQTNNPRNITLPRDLKLVKKIIKKTKLLV